MTRSHLLVHGAAALALCLGGAAPVLAQSTASWVPDAARGSDFELSIRNIMRGPEHVGQAPTGVRWTDDSRWVYFRWVPGGRAWDADAALWRVPAGGGTPEELTDAEADEAAPLIAAGDLSRDRRWRVSSVRGDLHLVDRRTMAVRRLTHTEDAEGSPLFGPDGQQVLFRRGNDVYRLTRSNGALEQLTRIEEGPAPEDEDEAEGQRRFLEEQQLELFEHVRREKARADEREARDSLREAGEPRAVYLERGERVASLEPTRDGRYVLVRTARPAEDAKRTIVPDWITSDGYTRDLTVRTKVGDTQGAGRLGLLATATGEITWLDTAPDSVEAGPASRVVGLGWNDAGTTAFVFAVSPDDKDRWLWSVDAESGGRTLLDHLHDDAWVAGPCFASCVGFVPGTDRIWFVSEESGWAHLYAVDADGTDRVALTSGEWEVLDVSIPEDRERFLLHTNEGSPFDEHVWWMDFDGSNRRAVTSGQGRWEAELSPDGRRFALLHDVADRPPELFIAEAGSPSDTTRVTTSPTEAWRAFAWRKPEIVRFPAQDGTMVPARVYRPREAGAEPNGAGVIFVHGAGYLHNVHNYWSSYSRE